MYTNILVPVAFEEGAHHEPCLRVARTLASDGATITLLHAFERPPAYAMNYVPTDLLKATRDGILAELQSMEEGLPGGRAVVVDGHPGRSICDWADRKGVDLIVMASHRPGFSDVIWGSTAAHVVRHVACAVHVQR
jgi:nucleotide-binding universal stress UspA family protein